MPIVTPPAPVNPSNTDVQPNIGSGEPELAKDRFRRRHTTTKCWVSEAFLVASSKVNINMRRIMCFLNVHITKLLLLNLPFTTNCTVLTERFFGGELKGGHYQQREVTPDLTPPADFHISNTSKTPSRILLFLAFAADRKKCSKTDACLEAPPKHHFLRWWLWWRYWQWWYLWQW